MDYRKSGREIAIRLDEDDEVVGSVLEVCRKEDVRSAYLNGIGAAKAVEISHFDTMTKQYTSKMFEGMLEVAAMYGNIAMFEGKQAAHIHIIIGKDDFTVAGGHLVKAVVNPTCEIIVVPLDLEIKKEKDEKTGLNLQKF